MSAGAELPPRHFRQANRGAGIQPRFPAGWLDAEPAGAV